MFTDMVGYTALGQRNESLSLALLEEQSKLIRPVLERHNGREVKTMGDAFLVEFPNAMDAVRCAYDIQRTTREHNISLPEDRRIRLRIGLHLGDVEESEGDIFGDSVNVASRIGPLASEGGICLTQQVYDQVANKFELPLVNMGMRALKNVEGSREVYSVRLPWEAGEGIPTGPSKNRIVVLPFSSLSPDREDEYFADGMTEELISAVSLNDQMKVISRTSAMAFKKTNKTAPEIGRELGVGTVLEGSVRKEGNKVRIVVKLIDAKTDELLWSQSYDREVSGVFEIQTDISTRVANALKLRPLVKDEYRLDSKYTTNVEAHTLYLKGLFHLRKETDEEISKAIHYFELALEQDPRFAMAYVGLADSYSLLGSYGAGKSEQAFSKAKAYILKALEIDETIPEAHAVLGTILQDYYWDLPLAEKEFKRAMELNPNWATIPHCYADYLALTGRLEHAITELRRAVELDPLSLDIRNCSAWTLTIARSDEQAIEECERMIKENPDFVPAYDKLERAYVNKRMYDAAVRIMEKAVAVSNGNPRAKAFLAHAYGLAGKNHEAELILADLLKMSDTQYVSPLFFAIAYAGLNQKDRAFEWLERAYHERSGALVKLKFDPIYDNLRSDPRFDQLLLKVGLS